MPIAFQANYHYGLRYQSFFGDGTTATGTTVRHTFPDPEGTLLDGSGRYLLTSTTAEMIIDDSLIVHSPKSEAQVCGSVAIRSNRCD
jgi:hypothetical protein